MRRASRQGNFSSLSLWILQVHSPELLSLSVPLGRDSSCCFGFIFFSLSDLQLFLLEGCSFPGRCSLTSDVPGLQRAPVTEEPPWALLLLLSPFLRGCCFICCCCCCFQPSPSPWGSLRSGFAADGPPMMLWSRERARRVCIFNVARPARLPLRRRRRRRRENPCAPANRLQAGKLLQEK